MKTDHTPDTLTQACLAELASFSGRPCLSLYQPTHRRARLLDSALGKLDDHRSNGGKKASGPPLTGTDPAQR